MTERERDELIGDMREHITTRVATGFDPPESVAESAVECFSDRADEGVLAPVAERLTREAVAARLREQAGWPAVTDCDRLDAAFAELTQSGVVARQNFSCCGTCGVSEIGDEMRDEADAGVTVRGYTFYHMQDTDSAAEGHGLYLNYGSTETDNDAMHAVARDIVATLDRHGLATEWDGSLRTRIHVRLDWKRRVAADPAGPTLFGADD